MIMGRILGLRPLQSDDAQFLYKWYNDPRVLDMLGSQRNSFCVSMDDERRQVQERMRMEHALYFMILEIEDRIPVGLAQLESIDGRNATAEINVMIGEVEKWGKGYCQESVELLLDHCFKVLNLHRVSLKVPEYNARAIDCFKHCGFQIEGRLRQDHYTKAGWRDSIVMAILKDEYGGG
jgi:RimJ/RimL family protein N-acetyltransferase